jgi:hypothetical protein
MLLRFPNPAVYCRVVRAGVIPAALLARPLSVWAGPDAGLTVQPHDGSDQLATPALARWGVAILPPGSPPPADAARRDCDHWLLAVPPQPLPQPPATQTQPVLLRVPMPAFVSTMAELVRLGATGIRYAWDAPGDAALLLVEQCPVYSALRTACQQTLAYHPAKPGVWLPYGTTHPLLDLMPTPAHGLVLIDQHARQTSYTGRFVAWPAPLAAALPAQPPTLTSPGDAPAGPSDAPAGSPGRLRLPLRVRPARGPARVAEPRLWYWIDDATRYLLRFVGELDERLIDHLQIAVLADAADRPPTILLRVRPESWQRVSLVLTQEGAVPLVPYPGLVNLYCKRGYLLQPPLRLDELRQRFAPDPKRLYWLLPGSPADALRCHSVAWAAFTPLAQWVDYTSPASRALTLTVPRLDWLELEPLRAQQDQPSPAAASPRPAKPQASVTPTPKPPPPVQPGQVPPRPLPATTLANPLTNLSVAEERLRTLTVQFLEQLEPFHSPAHQALWPELARCYADLGEYHNATICWVNALWGQPTWPADWIGSWLASVGQSAQPQRLDELLPGLLASTNPTSRELAAMAALVLHTRSHQPTAAWPAPLHWQRVCEWVRLCEERYPIRAVWLVWLAIYQSTGDLLTLARARDRLLGRLLDHGLNADRDLPGFLRRYLQASRPELAIDSVAAFDRVRQAVQAKYDSSRYPFLGLALAYGYARLGEADQSAELVRRARTEVDPAVQRTSTLRGWLAQAYEWRIEEALRGTEHARRWPAPLQAGLQALAGRERQELQRLRRYSRLLEPFAPVDPHRCFDHICDELAKRLSELEEASHPEQIELALRAARQAALAAGDPRRPEVLRRADPYHRMLRYVTTGLRLAGHLAESDLLEVIAWTVPTVQLPHQGDTFELRKRVQALYQALRLAAHYDRADFVADILAALMQLHSELPRDRAVWLVACSDPVVLVSLSRFGLYAEQQRLHELLTQIVLPHSLDGLTKRRYVNWPVYIPALLKLARLDLHLGQTQRASAILELVEPKLYAADGDADNRIDTYCVYVEAIGGLPLPTQLDKLQQLIDWLPPQRPTPGVYSLALPEQRLIETIVRGLLDDPQRSHPQTGRILDVEEAVVRRRIHADMQQARAAAGL